MKKTLSLLIALLFFGIGCRSALAETPLTQEKLFTCLREDTVAAPLGYAMETHHGEQSVYVPVTLVYHDATSAETETRIAPSVLLITYKYLAYRSESNGVYTGGLVYLNNTFPKLTVSDQSDMGLNVSCARVSLPVVAGVQGNGDTYTVTIRGGSFTVTYDAVIHYNAQGIISRAPTTMTRSYNFTETGP